MIRTCLVFVYALAILVLVAEPAIAQGTCPPEVNCYYYNGGPVALHTTVVTVSAETPWTATGVLLAPGDVVTIVAKGQAATVDGIFVGPEGWGGAMSPYHPVPTAAYWSLIARIGSSGEPFYVGSAVTLAINSPGELFLGYNDNVFGDNVGYFVAYVTRTAQYSTLNAEEVHPAGRPIRAFPNPTFGSSEIQLSLNARSEYRVDVVDVGGRLVKSLDAGVRGPGDLKVRWDGRDSAGHSVAAGTYFVRLATGDDTEVARVTIVR